MPKKAKKEKNYDKKKDKEVNKSGKILQEEAKEKDQYQPSAKAGLIINEMSELYVKSKGLRDGSHKEFNDSTLKVYINDCDQRAYSYPPGRPHAEEWQSDVVDPISRNKLMVVMGKFAGWRPGIALEVSKNRKYVKTELPFVRLGLGVIKDIYDFYEENDDSYEENQFFHQYNAAKRGTAISYIGWQANYLKQRKIKDYNLITGELNFDEEIIPEEEGIQVEELDLFDFIPGNIRTWDIQKQPFVFWRTVMDYHSFRNEFGRFKEATYVQAFGDVEHDSEYRNLADVADDQVEIQRFWNKRKDQYCLMANNQVWLNPINIGGEEVTSPFIYNHKQYPFRVTRYEPYSKFFFYGMACLMKWAGEQDEIDQLYRMITDQTLISMHPPSLWEDIDEIQDDYLRPGSRYPVSDVNRVKFLQNPPPSNSSFRLFETMKRSIDSNSADTAATIASVSPKTLGEAEIIASKQDSLVNLFQKFLTWSYKPLAKQKLALELQFGLNPQKVKGIIGDKGMVEWEEASRVFVREGVPLTDGGMGIKEINLVDNLEAIPEELKTGKEKATKGVYKGSKAEDEEPKTSEVLYTTPSFLRSIEYNFKLIESSIFKLSDIQKKQLSVRIFERFRGDPRVNQDRIYEDYFIDVAEKNPDEYLVPEEQRSPELSSELAGAQGETQERPTTPSPEGLG